ncbi:uncharacterized protein LOC141610869 [Silene latifolia]|uniref:uncharacterized protein LOC141610869 n=1 Tax=Silene latifolia TaxID=37657 RepID=UPI003D76DFA5
MKDKEPKVDTRMTAPQQLETPTPVSKPFTGVTDESTLKTYPYFANAITVCRLRPPHSFSSFHPWIATREITKDYTYIFRHPLTSKLHSFNLPKILEFSKFNASPLATVYSFREPYPVDNLFLLEPPHPRHFFSSTTVPDSTLLALYSGGKLLGCPRYARSLQWINLSPRGEKFDDIVVFENKVYAVDRQGVLKLINRYKTVKKINIGKTVVFEPVTPGSGRFGWRKRFAVDGGVLYLVVRLEEERFRVYMLKSKGKEFFWEEVRRFGGDKVLFMARDYYFFRRASRKFPGREYRNCIVFSEAAFPQYGKDGWEFTESDNVRRWEDDIAVFCLDNERFAREGEEEGENSGFPKIDWSPPDWILNFSSFSADAFKKHSDSEYSSSQSEREPNEDEGMDSDSGEKNDEEVQSGLKNPKIKDKEEQEEMESDFGCLEQDQDGVVSETDNQDKADGNMQCDLDSREKEDDRMHVSAATKGGASSQEDVCHVSPSFRPEFETIVTQTPSLSATEKEITRTLLTLIDGNNATTEEETLKKNNTELVHRACTSSTTVSHRSNTATAKFEGMDIRLDSVSTLEKIWQKHGNIVENCAVRNSEIIARALESLATIVRILDDSSALSLSDIQAEYIVSTLSDLRYIHFKVDWLIPFVEKAKKIHQSKASLESLNSLRQLNSEAEERRAILLEELTKLDAEEKKRKEEMAKISKTIPFCGQVKLDEPLGSGLT